jgi:hypothetical protein
MHTVVTLIAACALSSAGASAASIQFVQNGWSTGAVLNVEFSGQDADTDGAIVLPELTEFSAVWTAPNGDSASWPLPDIEPGGFDFTDLGNYLIFTRNADFSLVSTAFEGEALSSVFDELLLPVDSTVMPATNVSEPSSLMVVGLVAIEIWRRTCRRRLGLSRHRAAIRERYTT